MKVDNRTRIGSLAQIVEYFLRLFVEDLASVFSKGVDIEEVSGLFSLELPALSIGAENSYF